MDHYMFIPHDPMTRIDTLILRLDNEWFELTKEH